MLRQHHGNGRMAAINQLLGQMGFGLLRRDEALLMKIDQLFFKDPVVLNDLMLVEVEQFELNH